MEQMRSEFEAAVKEKFGDLIDRRLCKNGDGEYFAWDMQVAWWAWQASRAAVEIELPQRYGIDCFDAIEPDSAGHLFYRDEVIDAIRSAGLRVKEK